MAAHASVSTDNDNIVGDINGPHRGRPPRQRHNGGEARQRSQRSAHLSHQPQLPH